MIEKDKQKLIEIISTYLPQAKIVLFWSRARKDNTPESDIDIAIDNNNKIDFFILSNIKEDFEESTVPFSVDLVDLNSISEEFKNQILKDAIIWKK